MEKIAKALGEVGLGKSSDVELPWLDDIVFISESASASSEGVLLEVKVWITKS